MLLFEKPKEVLLNVEWNTIIFFSGLFIIIGGIEATGGIHLLANKLIEAQGGMTSWIPLWSDQIFFPLQCDYSAMISPQMFGEFVLPDLKEQTEYMDRSIYHLDGAGEFPHLEQILSLPRLNALQWAPGAGKPGGGDPCWFDFYRKVQAAGKSLLITIILSDNHKHT